MSRKFLESLLLIWAFGTLAVLSSPLSAAEVADSTKAGAPPDSVRSDAAPAQPRAGAARGISNIAPEERAELKHTLQMMARREVEGERLWQRRKIPKVALFSNAALPGLGQLYNGRRIKVALMVGVATYYMGNIWLNHKSGQRATVVRDKFPSTVPSYILSNQNAFIEFYKEQSKDYLWWSAAVWVIGMLDAWIDAHLYDIRVYSPPATESNASIPISTRYLTLSVSLQR